mmetsp:Transcript_76093/g.111455  ORF Transcript_76093/g.111455 Transcript_76093/m.111455 type:complete len:229 (-) Transcript_76093:51-737(-)
MSVDALFPLVPSLAQLLDYLAPNFIGSYALYFLTVAELSHAKQWATLRVDASIADFKFEVAYNGWLFHRGKGAQALVADRVDEVSRVVARHIVQHGAVGEDGERRTAILYQVRAGPELITLVRVGGKGSILLHVCKEPLLPGERCTHIQQVHAIFLVIALQRSARFPRRVRAITLREGELRSRHKLHAVRMQSQLRLDLARARPAAASPPLHPRAVSRPATPFLPRLT